MDDFENLEILLENPNCSRIRKEMIREIFRYYVFLDPPDMEN